MLRETFWNFINAIVRHECHDYSDTDMIKFDRNLEVYKKVTRYFLQVYILQRSWNYLDN